MGVIDMKQGTGSVLVTGILAALLLMASNAFADEIVKFDLVTTYTQAAGDLPPGSLDASGQIVIDTTTGVVDAIDLSFANAPAAVGPGVTESAVFGTPPNEVTAIDEAWCAIECGSDSDFQIGVQIVLPGDLVGYTGGPICSTETPCSGTGPSSYTYGIAAKPYFSGELTVSPEPSSLVLMLTGALGMVAALSRKKAKPVAA
jgi:hypothetical protein